MEERKVVVNHQKKAEIQADKDILDKEIIEYKNLERQKVISAKEKQNQYYDILKQQEKSKAPKYNDIHINKEVTDNNTNNYTNINIEQMNTRDAYLSIKQKNGNYGNNNIII